MNLDSIGAGDLDWPVGVEKIGKKSDFSLAVSGNGVGFIWGKLDQILVGQIGVLVGIEII